MIDVSEVVNDPELTRAFTVRRPTGAFGDEGVYADAYRDIAARGIIQPVDPQEVALLPEGERLANVISIWSTQRLIVADAHHRESDVVIIDGNNYKVIKVQPWGAMGSGYWQAWAEGYVTSA